MHGQLRGHRGHRAQPVHLRRSRVPRARALYPGRSGSRVRADQRSPGPERRTHPARLRGLHGGPAAGLPRTTTSRMEASTGTTTATRTMEARTTATASSTTTSTPSGRRSSATAARSSLRARSPFATRRVSGTTWSSTASRRGRTSSWTRPTAMAVARSTSRVKSWARPAWTSAVSWVERPRGNPARSVLFGGLVSRASDG